MEIKFGSILSQLRHESGQSQRQLASELKISQALLSHYENGAREPGLPFVCRVCDHFGISADELLGRAGKGEGGASFSKSMNGFQSSLAFSSKAVRDSADAYMDAAARRVSAHIHNRKSPLEAAEAAADMAAAELALLRALSKEDN